MELVAVPIKLASVGLSVLIANQPVTQKASSKSYHFIVTK